MPYFHTTQQKQPFTEVFFRFHKMPNLESVLPADVKACLRPHRLSQIGAIMNRRLSTPDNQSTLSLLHSFDNAGIPGYAVSSGDLMPNFATVRFTCTDPSIERPFNEHFYHVLACRAADVLAQIMKDMDGFRSFSRRDCLAKTLDAAKYTAQSLKEKMIGTASHALAMMCTVTLERPTRTLTAVQTYLSDMQAISGLFADEANVSGRRLDDIVQSVNFDRGYLVRDPRHAPVVFALRILKEASEQNELFRGLLRHPVGELALAARDTLAAPKSAGLSEALCALTNPSDQLSIRARLIELWFRNREAAGQLARLSRRFSLNDRQAFRFNANWS